MSGSLNPANETEPYRFNALAGDRFYFDSQARSGAPNARWRLIDPFGSVVSFTNPFGTLVSSSPLSSDIDTLTLSAERDLHAGG